ncbi:MAG: hypothetical protein M1824_004793 [Vezdaea acicularis]|nr:MAG: hypothetical protein M1824_004793 [Vezdaea acicularis]
MIQTYHPPLMEIAQDTLPELQPIFTYLNSHANKLYQEGYFLKLNDLDTHGRPNGDRTWTECFAQLVGTVLSLWDAAALDAAGQDGEVVPTFVNLTDASIKMIDTLPTRNQDQMPLQNVLSISTAGKNRYLLHFNSTHSLTQWTAGIRLAMYEHATLQEAYTGSLIAGKGKALNSIKVIMDRNRFKAEDWARVRFGAGTPWRRCWYVISPPDEKAYQKQQKEFKKKSAYGQKMPPLKGNIKFYDTKKTKKTQPIATITDAFSAYAIYPQSKPLIDQSTLVKVEGTITIHAKPASTTEGFVFVMPEVHPAVSGFEMMLRWLFPVFDTFALYGRPNRLIADTRDSRGLMFAMPTDRRYGYLEILDVATLIHTPGSQDWKEADWRKQMKDLTAKRVAALNENGSRRNSGQINRRAKRSSLPPSRGVGVAFDDGSSTRSGPAQVFGAYPGQHPVYGGAPNNGAAVPLDGSFPHHGHQRSVSESQGLDIYSHELPSQLDQPPPPPLHGSGVGQSTYNDSKEALNDRSSSDSENRFNSALPQTPAELEPSPAPEPVVMPPAFAHPPGAMPPAKPYHSPELRRANSRMSTDTLSHLTKQGGASVAAAGAAAAWNKANGNRDEQPREGASRRSMDANQRPMFHDSESGGFDAVADRGEELVGSRALYDRGLPPPPQEFRQGPSPLSQTTAYSPPVPQHTQYGQAIDYQPPNYSEAGQEYTPLKKTVSQHSSTYQSSPRPSADAIRHRAVGVDIGNRSRSPSKSPYNRSTESLPQSASRHSIHRKPLPLPKSVQGADRPNTASSTESFRNPAVDQAALDRVVARPGTLAVDRPAHPRLRRQLTDASSNYGDNESTDSPDYASTRKSTETGRSDKSVERQRAGVMKTVGTREPFEKDVVIGNTHYRADYV